MNFRCLVDFHAVVEVLEVVGAKELHPDDGEDEEDDEEDERKMAEIAERAADDSDEFIQCRPRLGQF